MCKLLLTLACLACAGLGRRVPTSAEQLQSSSDEEGIPGPLKSLASLFLAWNPASVFKLPAAGSLNSAARPAVVLDGEFAYQLPPSRSAAAPAMVDDKAEVKEYFNNEGFNRWSKIYSDNGEVNKVQLDIREGHAETVDKVLRWWDADFISGDIDVDAVLTVADVGCGCGLLALPLAERGMEVTASDISEAMVKEAQQRANAAGSPFNRTKFLTSDLESIEGNYDTVTCIDVMIHYPQDKMAQMVQSLATHADRRLIISFAPDTWYYRFLKKIGELFPGPSKTTRAYLHSEESVSDALEKAGFEVRRTEMTGTNFYFSRLLEAVKK